MRLVNRRGTWLVILAAATVLCGQIAGPRPGFVHYSDAPVQIITGVAGSLLSRDAIFGAAQAASFSDHLALFAGAGHLHLTTLEGTLLAEGACPEAAPLLAVGDRAESAVAWLPSQGSVAWFADGHLHELPLAVEGSVTSLSQPDAGVVRLLVSNADRSVSQARYSLTDGRLLSSELFPGAVAPAFDFAPFAIWAEDGTLHIEGRGSHRTIALPAAGALRAERMSERWVHLMIGSPQTHWGLDLGDRTHEPSLSRLPAPFHANKAAKQ